MKTGIELIAEERKRQIEVEGWTAEHDEEHYNGQLVSAAICYAIPQKHRTITLDKIPSFTIFDWFWNWHIKWWKPSPDNRIKELTKAGALIAAEIDRLLRKEAHQ